MYALSALAAGAYKEHRRARRRAAEENAPHPTTPSSDRTPPSSPKGDALRFNEQRIPLVNLTREDPNDPIVDSSDDERSSTRARTPPRSTASSLILPDEMMCHASEDALLAEYMNPNGKRACERADDVEKNKRRRVGRVYIDSDDESAEPAYELTSKTVLKRGGIVRTVSLPELLRQIAAPKIHSVGIAMQQQEEDCPKERITRISDDLYQASNTACKLRTLGDEKHAAFDMLVEPIFSLLCDLASVCGFEARMRAVVNLDKRKPYTHERKHTTNDIEHHLLCHYTSKHAFTKLFEQASKATYPSDIANNENERVNLLAKFIDREATAHDAVHLVRFACMPYKRGAVASSESSARQNARTAWVQRIPYERARKIVMNALCVLKTIAVRWKMAIACILRASPQTEAIVVDYDERWTLVFNLPDLGVRLPRTLEQLTNDTLNTLKEVPIGVDRECDSFDESATTSFYRCVVDESDGDRSSDSSYRTDDDSIRAGSGASDDEVDSTGHDLDSESIDSSDDDEQEDDEQNEYETESSSDDCASEDDSDDDSDEQDSCSDEDDEDNDSDEQGSCSEDDDEE